MAKNPSSTSRKPMMPSLRGKLGPVSLVFFAKAVSLVAILVAYYVIAFFAAVRVVPIVMGFVKSGTGVTMTMPAETIVSVWLAPSVFLIALVFVLTLVVMRFLWRCRRTMLLAVSARVLGRAAVVSPIESTPAPVRRRQSA